MHTHAHENEKHQTYQIYHENGTRNQNDKEFGSVFFLNFVFCAQLVNYVKHRDRGAFIEVQIECPMQKGSEKHRERSNYTRCLFKL